MNQNIFINEAFNEGVLNYLNKENLEDFTTVIIKTLISIYGELDIINPFKTNTESGLGSFDQNLTKFGYSNEDLSLFKQNVMNFYLSKNECPNKYFNEIEKQLIDMYFFKIKEIDKEKINAESIIRNFQFKNTNLNSIYSTDKNEIERYYNYKNRMASTNLDYVLIEESNTLNKEAYEMIGYSYDEIKKMNPNKLFDVNNEVFEYFKVDQAKDNKFLRLEQAIAYYKEFPKESNKKENGYVEFLLLAGFISVSLLVITIVIGVLVR